MCTSLLTKTAAVLLVVFVFLSSAEGRTVAKRSDDRLPDLAVVDQLASRVQNLEASLTVVQNKLDRLDHNVAFDVSFSAGIVSGVGIGVTVKFDDVIYNKGDNYDVRTGIFTVPVSGTYAFYLKLQTLGGKPHSLNILHNGLNTGHVFGDDISSYDMASTLEVVHAAKGDKFWVTSGHDGDFRGSGVTRFSGFLIRAD